MERATASLNLPKTIIKQTKKIGYIRDNSYINTNDIDPSSTTESLGSANIVSLQKAPQPKSALEIYKEIIWKGCVLSFNENLDCILKDVILPKQVIELAGESGSGKSQVCFQLCISVQLPRWCGGMEGEAVYLCSNSNFASHRIAELSTTFMKRYNSLQPTTEIPHIKFDENTILQHIYYHRVGNVTDLLACIKSLPTFLSDKHVHLIFVDSFSFILRKVDAKDRTTLISKILCDLRSLSNMHNLSIIITNDFTTRVNKGEAYVTPSLGNSWYHLVNSRILFSKKNNIFYATLEKNIMYGKKETNFHI